MVCFVVYFVWNIFCIKENTKHLKANASLCVACSFRADYTVYIHALITNQKALASRLVRIHKTNFTDFVVYSSLLVSLRSQFTCCFFYPLLIATDSTVLAGPAARTSEASADSRRHQDVKNSFRGMKGLTHFIKLT